MTRPSVTRSTLMQCLGASGRRRVHTWLTYEGDTSRWAAIAACPPTISTARTKWGVHMEPENSIAISLPQPLLSFCSPKEAGDGLTIAGMKDDAYAQEFDRAIIASGLRNQDIANSIGVQVANISHWRTGKRPMPMVYAEATARLLGAAPERISRQYLDRQRRALALAHVAEVTPAGAPAPADDRALVEFRYLPSHLEAGSPHTISLPRQLFALRPDLLAPTVMVAINNSDAMAGRIERGSLVFIDTSIKGFPDEGIYAYLWVSRPMLKYVQVIPDGFRLKGTAREDAVDVIDAKSAKALEPMGRFLAQLTLASA